MKPSSFIVYVLSALFYFATVAAAGVPNQITYQGRLTDNDGNPVPDGSYNLTFQIVEHDPLPMGESPLWSSGVQAVTVTDGLFVYYLGSNVPLPATLFTDGGLESHFVRINIEGSPVFGQGVQMVAVPFAIKATSADTAAYAHSGPGSGATGWVDDGGVVRLQSSGDRVGIGTASPSENLVVGGDLGSYPEANYVVSGNSDFEGYSGFKLGWNLDNHATINWYGDGDQLSFHTRFMGTDYNNTLVMREGKVGINNSYPREPLSIGPDLGAFYGDFVQMGRIGSGRYSGFMCGEDENNRGAMLWINNTNELRFGGMYDGVDYGATMTLKEGNVGIGTLDPAGLLHVVGPALDASVQLPAGSISNVEIANEAGGVGSYETGYSVAIDVTPPNPVIIDSCVIDAPATGVAIVMASASVYCVYNAGSAQQIHLGISKTTSIDRYVVLYGKVTGDTHYDAYHPVTAVDYFVISAGTTTFYFLAERMLAGAGITVAHDPVISAIFLPTWYGAGQSSAATSETDVTLGTGMERRFSANPDESTVSGIGPVVDLRAEFNSKVKALEEEFQRKLAELQSGK